MFISLLYIENDPFYSFERALLTAWLLYFNIISIHFHIMCVREVRSAENEVWNFITNTYAKALALCKRIERREKKSAYFRFFDALHGGYNIFYAV